MKARLAFMVALSALALPALAHAGGRSGVVAKVDVRSGLVAVAQGRGNVRLVHASASALRGLRPGSRVSFAQRARARHDLRR
jgi:hypothetical protein